MRMYLRLWFALASVSCCADDEPQVSRDSFALAPLLELDYEPCPPDTFHPAPVGSFVGAHKEVTWTGNQTALKRRIHHARKLRQAHKNRCTCMGPTCLESIEVPRNADVQRLWLEEEQNHARNFAVGLSREAAAHHRGKGAYIAFYNGFEGNVAVGMDGRVMCILTLERLFDRRYWGPKEDTYRQEWLQALIVVRDRCDCEGSPCPSVFDKGALVMTDLGNSHEALAFIDVVAQVFIVKEWQHVNHHEAHALLGYHSSPFHSALVLSYDGGGDDGTFNAYLGVGERVSHIAQEYFNLGQAYKFMAGFLPELTGIPNKTFCEGVDSAADDSIWIPYEINMRREFRDSLAGKLMGYSGVGDRKSVNGTRVREVLEFKALNSYRSATVSAWMLVKVCESVETQRDIAAAIQNEFENLVLAKVEKLLDYVSSFRPVDGIVVTGGCALNILTNQVIRDQLTKQGKSASGGHRSGVYDVYLPPAPNDEGISVGGLFAIHPPLEPQPLQYLGFRLWDEETIEREAHLREAQSLEALGGVEYLAKLLACSAKPIVAIVRGRQEFGPRALGHRSLVAVPDSEEIRDRMNRLKVRKWYRPVAPMLADEALEEVFGSRQRSPHMEFAPRVLSEVREKYPGLTHVDGTARHQSVRQQDEPWVHALLLAVGRLTGLAGLINTSFNTKGKPLVNTVQASLEMLDTLPDLDYVLINDWLFTAPKNKPGV